MRLPHVIVVLFFSAAVPFARQLVFGAGFLDDDVFSQSLPAWEWFSHALRSGESVLWSPEILGGFPIAFTQYPFLYPPTWLLVWVLPPFQAYAWSLVLHLFLTGFLTYAYCRVVGLSRGASLLAAVSFQMSTEVATGGAGFTARSIFVLPGVLLASELILRGGWRYGPLMSFVVGAAFLGGHMPWVVMGLGVGGAYILFCLAPLVFSSGMRAAASRAGLLLLSGALGVVVAGVRLLPTWDVMALSTRASPMPPDAANAGALSLQGLLLGCILPLSHIQTISWGAPDYAGPAVVVLAALGSKSLIGRPMGRFFLGVAVVAALLSLGERTPLHELTRLPLLSLFREPSRFSVVAAFALSILGGVALDEFWPRGSKSVGRWMASGMWTIAGLSIASVGGLFCLGCFFSFGTGPAADSLRAWILANGLDVLNPLRPRIGLALLGLPAVSLPLAMSAVGRLSRHQAEALLVAATTAVLVPLAAILSPCIDAEVARRVPETVRFLERQADLQRIYSHIPAIRMYNHVKTFGPEPEQGFADDFRYRYQAEMLSPNLSWRWGIESVDGYEQLHSRQQEVMLRYIMSERMSRWLQVDYKWARISLRDRVRVLRMLNVRYITSAVDLSEEVPELRLVASLKVDPGLSRAAPTVFLLENADFLPRYYLVAQGMRMDDGEDPLYAVATGQVDPATVVLLQDVDAASAAASPATPDAPSGPWERSVEVLAYHNADVLLKVSTDRPAYLVTSDSYWPGWRAYVDGQEVPVLRANVTGRAVWLGEGGTHLVSFSFEPPGFALGLGISMAAALAWFVWLGLSVYSRRKVTQRCAVS